jgi:hypothetical protein
MQQLGQEEEKFKVSLKVGGIGSGVSVLIDGLEKD